MGKRTQFIRFLKEKNILSEFRRYFNKFFVYEYLSIKIRSEFNIESPNDVNLKNYFLYTTPECYIYDAFDWSKTKRTMQFWNNISKEWNMHLSITKKGYL